MKRPVIIPQSDFEDLKTILDMEDLWGKVDVVVVRDEDYDEAIKLLEANLPETKVIRKFVDGIEST